MRAKLVLESTTFKMIQDNLSVFLEKHGLELKITDVQSHYKKTELIFTKEDKKIIALDIREDYELNFSKFYQGNFNKTIIEYEGKEISDNSSFIWIADIWIDDNYRRLGIYSEIINIFVDIAKKADLNGIISLPYDLVSDRWPRSSEATSVWEKLFQNQSNVTKIPVNYDLRKQKLTRFFNPKYVYIYIIS